MNQSDNPKKPIRYGITPLAFIEVGWLIMLVAGLLVSGLDRLIGWLIGWLIGLMFGLMFG